MGGLTLEKMKSLYPEPWQKGEDRKEAVPWVTWQGNSDLRGFREGKTLRL